MKFINMLFSIFVALMFVPFNTFAFDDKKIYESQKRLSVGFELGTAEGDANVDRYGGLLRYNFDQLFQSATNIEEGFTLSYPRHIGMERMGLLVTMICSILA